MAQAESVTAALDALLLQLHEVNRPREVVQNLIPWLLAQRQRRQPQPAPTARAAAAVLAAMLLYGAATLADGGVAHRLPP